MALSTIPETAHADSTPVTVSSSDFAREWTKAQHGVLAFIGSLAVDFDDAEDLLQETAAQAFAQIERYDPARPFLPWVFGIARYVVMEHYRKRGRDRHVFDQTIIGQIAEAIEDISDRNDSLYKALAHCREKLPSRSKYVCRLRYDGNLPPQEIAARMGTSSGMVRALLHRVRDQLRRCIEQRLQAEGLSS